MPSAFFTSWNIKENRFFKDYNKIKGESYYNQQQLQNE